MKKILLISSLLATLVLAGCGTNDYQYKPNLTENNLDSSSPQRWTQFTSTIGKFIIDFPIYPTDETSTSTYNQRITYHTEDTDGTFYIAGVWIYPEIIDKTKIETSLEHALNWIINSSQGDELISSNFDYMPATRVGEGIDDIPKVLNYIIKNKNEDRYIQWRMVIIDNIYYDLKIISYTNLWNQENYDKFIDSFRPTY